MCKEDSPTRGNVVEDDKRVSKLAFSSENDWGIVTLFHSHKCLFVSDYYEMYPHFFDRRKETAVQPPKKRLSTPNRSLPRA
ncbi:MAG: hypothetical protein IKD39_01500, partial [Oscillospiraceae bacterium]|nr:hypothetical protein [Oscillospiraceae bacterium]